MPNTTPWLWFDSEAEDAAEFYVSVFPNSGSPMSRATALQALGPRAWS